VSHPLTGQPESLPPAQDSMTFLVAAVIVHDKITDRVLLLQRGPRAKFARGHWDLPIGKSEPGEAVTATAVRELYEETGVTVRPQDLRLAHVVHSAHGIEAPNGFLTVVFVTDTWSGDPENREPGKHAEVRWFDTGALPEPFVRTTILALRGYLAGGPQLSLRGWE
jgi:8-oxo-dGTP pyrophosphatase MutT (NUDIX family)